MNGIEDDTTTKTQIYTFIVPFFGVFYSEISSHIWKNIVPVWFENSYGSASLVIYRM